MRLSAFVALILSASTAFALSKPTRPYRRTLVHDVCGSINSNLVLNEVLDSQGKATVAGHLEACLCLSDVDKFVESNIAAQAAVELLGDHVKVEAMISSMIQALPDSQCTYPDHARALCTDSNPCDFECTDGYLASPPERPTTCKCPDHLMECDGKCGHFKECSNKAPLSRRSNEPQCASGLTMCGIVGTGTGQPWKCVDINTNPTTCGGCLQVAPSGNAPVTGLNCKDIKGIKSDTVTCGKGHCIVNDCIEGFFVAPAKDSCIPLPQSAPAGSKGSAAITADGSSEGVKVSRDELAGGLAHGAGANPLVGGAQGAGASIPVGSGLEGTTSARVTRDVVQDVTGVNPVLVAVGSMATGTPATSDESGRLVAGVKQATIPMGDAAGRRW